MKKKSAWKKLKEDARSNWETVKKVGVIFSAQERKRFKEDAVRGWKLLKEFRPIIPADEKRRLKQDAVRGVEAIKQIRSIIPADEKQRLKQDTARGVEAIKQLRSIIPADEKQRLKDDTRRGLTEIRESKALLWLATLLLTVRQSIARSINFLLEHRVLLFFFTAIGFFQRLFGLGEAALWTEEIGLWLAALGPQKFLTDGFLTLQIPYLLMLLLHDSSDLLLRLPSAVAGGLSVYVIAKLGAQIGSPRAGLVAAALLAVSPAHGILSTIAGSYGLFGLGLLLVLYAFLSARALALRFADDLLAAREVERWGAWRAWAVYGAAVAFFSGTAHNFPHVLLPLLVVYGWECWTRVTPRLWRDWCLCAVATLVCSVPALAYLPKFKMLNQYLLPNFELQRPLEEPLISFLQFLGPTPRDNDPSLLLLSLVGGTALLLLGSAVVMTKNRQLRATLRFLTLVFLCSALLTFSWIAGRPNWMTLRFVPHLIVLLYLLIGFGCLAFDRLHPRVWRVPAFAIVAVYVAFGLEWSTPEELTIADTRTILAAHQNPELAQIDGFILEESSRTVAAFGREYSGTKPVFVAGHYAADRRNLDNLTFDTIREHSRGNVARVLVQSFPIDSIDPGRYLITRVDPTFRCEALLGGKLGHRFLDTSWHVCDLPKKKPAIEPRLSTIESEESSAPYPLTAEESGYSVPKSAQSQPEVP